LCVIANGLANNAFGHSVFSLCNTAAEAVLQLTVVSSGL